MIKKISALILALMLCLSVVVMPASAAGVELGDATFAIALEWDKTSYKGGDTAILKLYADGADDLSFFTGAITFGLSSDVFDPNVNTTQALRDGSTTAEWFEAYYQPGTNAVAQLASTIATKVTNANTAEEQALYDWYVKVGFTKNGSGWHANTSTTKDGFYGSDFVADEPFMTLSFTVREDVADSTAVRAAITSGTLSQPSATAPSTYIKYFKTPGSATTTANVATTATSITKADTTVMNGGTDVTIGGAGLAVSYWKDQIRFQADDAGKYANKFDYRILATIDGFADIFEDVADAKDTSDNDGILEAGFIFSRTGAVDKDTAIAQINGGTATYSAVTNAYVSTSFDGKEYVMACYVGGIADADVDASLSALGYVKYVVDGEEDPQVVTFDAAQTSTFRTLYNNNFSNAFPAA
ncbi:MAG: hypothetical protein IKB36_00390 [Clostridia bacterium]|nr:hypothetical protein [Clostridia bacterium]